jgi:hypothetical protein
VAWTKLDFVKQAFEEIGYASYIYDAMPEQLESVRIAMDAMVATWYAKGVSIGYPIPSSPDAGSVAELTSVPDSANEAVYCGLAVRIAPRFGKAVSVGTQQAAKQAYDALLIKGAKPLEMQLPNTLNVGAGNKPWRVSNRPYINTPTESLSVGTGNDLTF